MDKIYGKVAEELDINEHVVETVLRHKFSWLRKQLTEMNYPAILDNNFGTFYVPEGKVRRYLTYLESKPKEGDEKLQKEIDKYSTILAAVTKFNKNKKIKKKENE